MVISKTTSYIVVEVPIPIYCWMETPQVAHMVAQIEHRTEAQLHDRVLAALVSGETNEQGPPSPSPTNQSEKETVASPCQPAATHNTQQHTNDHGPPSPSSTNQSEKEKIGYPWKPTAGSFRQLRNGLIYMLGVLIVIAHIVGPLANLSDAKYVFAHGRSHVATEIASRLRLEVSTQSASFAYHPGTDMLKYPENILLNTDGPAVLNPGNNLKPLIVIPGVRGAHRPSRRRLEKPHSASAKGESIADIPKHLYDSVWRCFMVELPNFVTTLCSAIGEIWRMLWTFLGASVSMVVEFGIDCAAGFVSLMASGAIVIGIVIGIVFVGHAIWLPWQEQYQENFAADQPQFFAPPPEPQPASMSAAMRGKIKKTTRRS